jgi:hypothetical protein
MEFRPAYERFRFTPPVVEPTPRPTEPTPLPLVESSDGADQAPPAVSWEVAAELGSWPEAIGTRARVDVSDRRTSSECALLADAAGALVSAYGSRSNIRRSSSTKSKTRWRAQTGWAGPRNAKTHA